MEQFLGWARTQLAAAPSEDDPQGFLAWWPTFKDALAGQLHHLNHRLNQQRQPAPASREALQALQGALQSYATATAADVSAALQRCLAAQVAYQRALALDSLAADQRAKFAWLHRDERGGPLLSRIMKPVAAGKQIVALKAQRGGGLITAPAQLATAAVQYFSQVSKQPAVNGVARARVLQAVRAQATPLIPERVALAADKMVSVHEVRRAVGGLNPGTAPGPDGLPAQVWKLGAGVLQPLLARLFSVLGASGRVPVDFVRGAVVLISKEGDATDLSNYRPITLLNTDYRVLARVLAARWGPLLGAAVGPEQSAFLPGRRIGDNVLFLQLLPAALAAARQSGAVAFLDFRKAYDTVDRDFLFEMLKTVGGEALVPWVSMLLSDTSAVAVVNRVLSEACVWQAGVRQGCPLSPLLYLLVSWALSCWLKAHPEDVGLNVAGQHCHCVQYADDNQVLLPSARPEVVQRLINRLDVFGDATGQRLQPAKCKLLPVGAVPWGERPWPVPVLVCGVPVVAEAKALGITFRATLDVLDAPVPPSKFPLGMLSPDAVVSPEAGADWTGLVSRCKRACAKVSRLPLSAFGRAAAASTYACSTLLYHAEFAGLPVAVADDLCAMLARLVDRKVCPSFQPVADQEGGVVPAVYRAQRSNALPGLRSALLPGKPVEGGFGLLPLAPHVQARHLVWALRFIWCAVSPGPAPAWVSLVVSLLAVRFPSAHPALALLLLAAPVADGALLPETVLPGPLQRMVAALRAMGPLLPPVAPDLDASGRVFGGSVALLAASMPVWGNPLLSPWPAEVNRNVPAEQHHWFRADREPLLASLPAFATVGDLLLLRNRAAQTTNADQWKEHRGAAYRAVWAAEHTLSAFPSDLQFLVGSDALPFLLLCLWTRVPEPWRAALGGWGSWRPGAVPVPASTPDTRRVAALKVLKGMAWAGVRPASVVSVLCSKPRVKFYTPLLCRDQVRSRGARLSRFVQDALSASLPPPVILLPAAPVVLGVPDVPGLPAVVDAPGFIEVPPVPDAALAQRPAGRALPSLEVGLAHLAALRRKLWRLPMENRHKESFWRLTVNGVSGAGGCDICPAGPCPCGFQLSADARRDCASTGAPALRLHTFWQCPVAQAVCRLLSRALPVGCPLLCAHLWLCLPPDPTVVPVVWQVVCMAAVSAMEYGRRAMWAAHLEANPRQAPPVPRDDPVLRQLTLFEVWQLEEPPDPAPVDVPVDPVAKACRLAEAAVLCNLQTFASAQGACVRWARGADVHARHPFLAYRAEAGESVLVVNVPPAPD